MSWPEIPTDSDWIARGNIYLWRYEAGSSRNFRGWHLTLDPPAAESFADLLQRMRQAGKARKRTLPLTQPAKAILNVPNNRRAKAIGAVALRVVYDPAVEPERWSLNLHENTVTLEMGTKSLDGLINGVASIAAGDGDFSIGDPPLWFWWHPA